MHGVLSTHSDTDGSAESAGIVKFTMISGDPLGQYRFCCNKIAEAEAAVSVNEKKWLVMHMHVQLKLDELRAPPNRFCSGCAHACAAVQQCCRRVERLVAGGLTRLKVIGRSLTSTLLAPSFWFVRA